MDAESEVAAVIPALNCAGTIGDVVRGALRFVETVLVVSDGSTDATAERAAEAGALVLRHATNLGKGAALDFGLRNLAEHGFRLAVSMDGDGQHLHDQLPLLLAESRLDPTAIVIGARVIEPGMATAPRLFGNRFANRWVEIACGLNLPDTQSGLRLYPVKETLALGVRARHFAFETEVLIRAARAGIAIRSVPVRAYYPPASERRSHYRPVLDTVRIILVVLGLIFRVW